MLTLRKRILVALSICVRSFVAQSGSTRRGQHLFPECVSEHAFGGWRPTKGELHRLLHKGEYNLIEDAPIFEGTFVQVTKRGEFIGILNHPNIIILGILASTPTMLLPDLMIIARDRKEGNSKTRKLEIARLIPLELVEIYVHNLEERRLKIHMVTGRNYYLQLCAPDGEEGVLFERWMRLIYLLHKAAGRANALSNMPSKDIGLHTIWKTASMPSETQSWLPVIMDKGSSEEIMKWSTHDSSARMEGKSKQSAGASRRSSSKPGTVQPSSRQLPGSVPPEVRSVKPSSRQLPGTVPPEACTSGERPRGSVSKGPSQLKGESATQQSKPEFGPRPRRFSTCKPCAHSPPPSFASVAIGTSEFDTMSVGVGPSVPFTHSEAVGPSQPLSRVSVRASGQARSTEQPNVTAGAEGVVPKDSVTTERESWESGEVPLKLEKSQKSRSLVETATSQQVSQSHRQAPSLKEKSATEAQVTSRGSSRSARPLTPGEGGGLASQSASRKSQLASRAASTRGPSAGTVARSRMSAAVGSSDAYTRSVAVGPSEWGVTSVAVGPSQPPSQASRMASARASAFPAPQPAGYESRATPARSEVAEGDMGSRPISREMSVKSKPSEKQGTSPLPSGVQSQGRTSAPYSQMAGMYMEPKEDLRRSRPLSREMSVKSKPSEKQGTSPLPSGVQSQGRTSAPYSQMAGMYMEPQEDLRRSRPLSREMSVKSKPSEKQGTSPLPSGVQSQGRTSAPYSQMAGMYMEPQEDLRRSRPLSREMSVKSKPSEKRGTSAPPSKLPSQGRPSPLYSQTAGMEAPKLSQTKSSKPVTSSGPFQQPGRYTSSSPTGGIRKGGSQFERKYVSRAAGLSEPGIKSVGVGPSQPFSWDRSRAQSRTLDTSKSAKMRTGAIGKKSKSGDKTQPSSATEKQVPPREKKPKSKSRLKDALSSARQRSSLTFVTIYSVLSSSMERLRGSRSKEDAKLQEQQLENIASKQSKRVTISGVIGPSGKSIQMEDPMEPSEMNTLQTDGFGSTTATLGSDPGILSTPQSFTGTSQPTVAANNAEGSASPSKLGGSPSDQILLSSRPSERPALSKEASVSTEVLPPQSRTSTDMGTLAEGTKSTVTASPASANWGEPGQPSMRSRQQSQTEDVPCPLQPSFQPSAVATPPDRSRVSVGVGRSVVYTKSEAVGPSVRGSLRDAAVGPSTAGSWRPPGESRVQTRQPSRVEDDWRPSSQPSAVTRPLDRSRVSVGVGRSIVDTKSAAVGPSARGSWKEPSQSAVQSRQPSQRDDNWRPRSRPSAQSRPPDRSRMSVGVGRSIIETKSVGVGRSQRETVSEGAGPSMPGSKIVARNPRVSEGNLQELGVFQPEGWLGTVMAEDRPVYMTSTAAPPGPSNRASRVTTPSGGSGNRATRDASARSYK